MKDTSKISGHLKATGGVGKGWATTAATDSSKRLTGPSVNSGADRGAKVAKCSKPLGPRTA
jgi:hypothetical protein